MQALNNVAFLVLRIQKKKKEEEKKLLGMQRSRKR